MRKPLVTILVILVCLVLIFILTQGLWTLILSIFLKQASPQDWYVPLPGEYEIWRINSQRIVLVKQRSEVTTETVIEKHINAYCYDQRYIGLWCAKDGPDDLLGVALEADAFYLVDSLDDLIYGPLDSTTYTALCEELMLFGFDQWTRTAPKVPPDAIP